MKIFEKKLMSGQINETILGPDCLDRSKGAARDAGGLRVMNEIANKLRLHEADAAKLLGIDVGEYQRAQREASAGFLSQPLIANQVLRLSYTFGIWNAALKLMSSEEGAIAVLTSPNSSTIFEGRKPMQVMIESETDGLAAIRRWFDGWAVGG